MKKLLLFFLLAMLAASAFARDVGAFVSVDWLEANLANERLVVLDARKVDEYRTGHVPGAVNVLGLYVNRGGLNAEVPEADDLSELIAEAGIEADSIVVVVETDGARLVWSTRVAWTLVYAGIPNVAVLDGGYAAWTKAGKRTATGFESRDESAFQVRFVDAYKADKAYVLANLKKAQIIDNRGYDGYFGLTKVAFVEQFGHIKGATALPSAWITVDGLVRPQADLEAILQALKLKPRKDSIVHCDSGVACAAWWWVLTQQMGWSKVRLYDGSAQEISKEPGVQFVKYAWQ